MKTFEEFLFEETVAERMARAADKNDTQTSLDLGKTKKPVTPQQKTSDWATKQKKLKLGKAGYKEGGTPPPKQGTVRPDAIQRQKEAGEKMKQKQLSLNLDPPKPAKPASATKPSTPARPAQAVKPEKVATDRANNSFEARQAPKIPSKVTPRGERLKQGKMDGIEKKKYLAAKDSREKTELGDKQRVEKEVASEKSKVDREKARKNRIRSNRGKKVLGAATRGATSLVKAGLDSSGYKETELGTAGSSNQGKSGQKTSWGTSK